MVGGVWVCMYLMCVNSPHQSPITTDGSGNAVMGRRVQRQPEGTLVRVPAARKGTCLVFCVWWFVCLCVYVCVWLRDGWNKGVGFQDEWMDGRTDGPTRRKTSHPKSTPPYLCIQTSRPWWCARVARGPRSSRRRSVRFLSISLNKLHGKGKGGGGRGVDS